MTVSEGQVQATEGGALVFWTGKGYVSQQTLITRDKNGNQVQWAYAGQVEQQFDEETPYAQQQRLEQNLASAERGGYTYHVSGAVQCEWPTESEWRRAQCGRSAAPSDGGLALCWQHEDKAFSDTMQRLRDGKLTPLQVEKLIHALLEAEKTLGGWHGVYGHIKTSPLVYAQVIEYLRGLTEDKDGKHWYVQHEVQKHLDRLIEKRLQQKFGEGDNE